MVKNRYQHHQDKCDGAEQRRGDGLRSPGCVDDLRQLVCICKKASRRARKNHAKINCSAPSMIQVEGVANRLRNSLWAIVRIMALTLVTWITWVVSGEVHKRIFKIALYRRELLCLPALLGGEASSASAVLVSRVCRILKRFAESASTFITPARFAVPLFGWCEQCHHETCLVPEALHAHAGIT